jgi:hypothetical protein
MIEGIFIIATRELRNSGWHQRDNPELFWHPEFGAHDLFKACYIQCNAKKIRCRRRLMTVAVYGTLAALTILAGLGLMYFVNGSLL